HALQGLSLDIPCLCTACPQPYPLTAGSVRRTIDPYSGIPCLPYFPAPFPLSMPVLTALPDSPRIPSSRSCAYRRTPLRVNPACWVACCWTTLPGTVWPI